MPVLPPFSIKTMADVTARARGILNDRAGSLWTDTRLQPHLKNSYSWVYNNIAIHDDPPFIKVMGSNNELVYTQPGGTNSNNVVVTGTAGQPQDLNDGASLLPGLPADMFLPFKLEYRLNSSEGWQDMDRRDVLPSMDNNPPLRVSEWEWRNRTIFVNSASQGGFIRIRYLSILPDVAVQNPAPIGGYTDPILMDNVVEALAYFAAADAFRSRGQHSQATAALGAIEPVPYGAMGFMDQVLKILVLQQQYQARRGKQFTEVGIDATNNRADQV